MAMMMTGRVLLVCALCVLWCGACGVYARNRENKALDGCTASGEFGKKKLYLSSGCNKTALTLSLRSVLPIVAAEVSVDENDYDQTVIGPALVSSEEPSILPPAALSDVSVAPGVGGVGGVGGGGESGASNLGSPGSGGGSQLGGVSSKATPSGVLPTPLPHTPQTGEGLQPSGVKPSTPSRDPQTTITQSGEIKTPSSTTPPKVEALVEGPKPEAERQVANTHEEANSQVTGVNANENSTDKRATREETPPIVLPIDSTPPVKLTTPPPLPTPEVSQPKASPPVTVSETGESSTTRDLSQEPKTQTNENSPSQNKTEPEALKELSGDAETEQQDQDKDASNMVKAAVIGRHAETTSSSISTNDSDDAQSTGDENNDKAERPSPKETSNHTAHNTNDAPTSTEAAPPTAKTATIIQTNDTATKGDSDGSTAVSHTTSPLLLLVVVACAAAVVVAA
ncbi:Mucin-associated surface protein (MASP) [Trypanosoma cruzi]|uniref:Mucin-associated surface protein (MASP), putative n=2 Tax=Trypanosoma cruzi TaxID=5693 RepID=Q4CVK0_TRYCC|nr:mucin-associated surface protein (MASP), putative [Trypanosoma cruzi]EAN84303.1 mucin-associated surface protein (MASP), putative [Trypanosoma cruzi]PWU88670.1 Mucin-associated surface protein (MASP) [Trypanosoma cruzi]RNC39718.1 mucin-associated surface protein (MASP) [Trypanosoma cruzi]|eukprot:XP_806154.1 mucin-associated surface protein (MASP) [Trypanosoma cruzi strain CL Brener]